ncbi:tyrosine-type recombinase/integrase [Pseudomonas syringae]
MLGALELRERSADGAYADASHNPWIRPIMQLAIETAMRRGEIFELRWKHVNLDRRTAHPPPTKNGWPEPSRSNRRLFNCSRICRVR